MRANHAVSEQSISVKEAEAKAQAAKVNAAEQNVRNFEALIRFKTIVAPYDGVVTVRNINAGDYVNKEGTISSRLQYGQQSLYRGRRQYVAPLCQRARDVRALPPAGPDGRRDGTAIAQSSFHRQIPDCRPGIRCEHTHRGHRIHDRKRGQGPLARLLCHGPSHSSDREEVLTIPSTAMVFQEHGTQVAVVTEDDRVHFKSIAVSKILDNAVEVTEGISTSDRIINNPSAALLEGDKVRIVTPAPGYDLSTTEVPKSKEPSSK